MPISNSDFPAYAAPPRKKVILSSLVLVMSVILSRSDVTSSDTATLPGRMLLQCVIHHIVVQERQVIIESDGPTAGARGRVFVQLLVVCEVVEDLVIVGLCLDAGAAAVPEDQLLFSLVAQPQVRHIEMDFLQQAASTLH